MRVAAILTLLLTGAALVIAATATPTAAHSTATAACGSDYWALKTFSDPLRKKVKLTPKDTTVTEIGTPDHPHPTPTTRDTPFELQVWRVTAQITKFKREGDSDIHLILFDAGTYGIAEMPSGDCVPKKARARKAIINARKKFEAACGTATGSWTQLGAVVTISGVGFWDKPHTQNPHAPNFAELHPVTAIKFISGCGA
jgi:hypothetical protein